MPPTKMTQLRLNILQLIVSVFMLAHVHAWSQSVHYKISIPNPATNQYQVDLHLEGWNKDTLVLKMPQWMPGYYQLMDYGKAVQNISVKDEQGKDFPFQRLNDNTVQITGARNKVLSMQYAVLTKRKFVATSYVDREHAYLAPTGTFFYVDGYLSMPVTVEIVNHPWRNIATGLKPIEGKSNHFTAPDFDILYDCPILIGDLEELPSFNVTGVEHRFIGYTLGSFDKVDFMNRLKKVSEAAVAVIGDIPFDRYTFIAIGPGRGGIEHLNNTTVSFDGNSLTTEAAMNRMMNFLAHEYFHHYNVKRIRPFELGPFDYEKGSRTNLLWISEGLTVYYEYLIVKRAGLADERTLLANLEGNINAHENNPGRFHQSLQQASYATWKYGPFGTQGDEPGKSISYYDKGPVVGMLLDFAIRQSTKNKKSLDDVMRELYRTFYQEKGRGFTEAELQQVCEDVAGTSLAEIFDYVYTTKELDYIKFLGYAGLTLETIPGTAGDKQPLTFNLKRIEKPDALQQAILTSWLGED